MATARPCRAATINIDGDDLSGIVDASVTLNMETIEITEHNALDRSYVAGIRNGSAQGNVFYDVADAAQSSLEGLVLSGAAVTFLWEWYSGQQYSVSGIVTSWSPSIAVNDVVKCAFSIQFTGAVTINPS